MLGSGDGYCSIDTPGVIDRVSTLFRGHPSLIQGFNTFLPPGYRIECSVSPGAPGKDGKEARNIITVTTPMGVTTRTQDVGGTEANEFVKSNPHQPPQAPPGPALVPGPTSAPAPAPAQPASAQGPAPAARAGPVRISPPAPIPPYNPNKTPFWQAQQHPHQPPGPAPGPSQPPKPPAASAATRPSTLPQIPPHKKAASPLPPTAAHGKARADAEGDLADVSERHAGPGSKATAEEARRADTRAGPGKQDEPRAATPGPAETGANGGPPQVMEFNHVSPVESPRNPSFG